MTYARIVLGVDIGDRGAIVVLTEDGGLVAAMDMPVLADGPAGRRAKAALIALAGLIRERDRWRT